MSSHLPRLDTVRIFFFGGKKAQMMRKKVAKRTEEIAGARIRKLDGDGLFMARLAMVLVGVLQG
jgi:hypothetical protein